jgi:hypothetical protein
MEVPRMHTQAVRPASFTIEVYAELPARTVLV